MSVEPSFRTAIFFISFQNYSSMSKRKILLLSLIFLFSALIAFPVSKKAITPETALKSYLQSKDKTFGWKVINSSKSEGLSTYQIVFSSQTWRGIHWRHELFVMVPDKLTYNDALLFITGGSVTEGQPNLHKMEDELVKAFGQMAIKNQAITSIIWQVPNQPLYGGKTEDELISYTYHNFLNDGDYSWPLLFPMTKSAVKAMDVIQLFAKKELKHKVNEFVVSGASKRGWTTWLTAAIDARVKAIAPMVIDVLNMPVSIEYHKVNWGDYSIQIEDYVNLGIAQKMSTEGGQTLVQMVDPYSYRRYLTMPKMIFMGTNDEYWPVDAIKNYIDSIPGENHICYIANAGHGLGDKRQALNTLSAFFGMTITNSAYPLNDYSISEKDNKIEVQLNTSAGQLVGTRLWTSTSADREFRDKKWSSADLGMAGTSRVNVEVAYPGSGYKAFYVELVYKTPLGHEYTETTRMFLTSASKVLLGISE
jgi:PhoPQ-activated pathogenicity-related protein